MEKMFKKDNFCHIASNNRNEQKAGVFVYKTTDDLATVSVSGYFNEKIIDINLHDLIIHEWHDATDKTKVQRNILCVIERTLDNVGTVVIKSKWEGDIEAAIENFVKIDGTSIMTAPLKFMSGSMRGAVGPYFNGVGFWKLDSQANLTQIASISDSQFIPTTTSAIDIGNSTKKWKDLYLSGKAYVGTINNGYDISIPAYAGTIVVADFTSVTAGQILALDSNLKPVWQDAPTIPTVGDGTITITQGGTTKGTFTVNQSGDTTIDLDAGGSGFHPDLFDFKWADHILDDVQWLRADTFSWQSGAVYEAAYWDLFYDMQISTYWYSSGGPAYTKSRTPAAGDAVYLNSDLTTQIGTVDSYDDVNDEITVSGNTYSYMSNTYVTPTTETVAGYTVTVYTGHSGKKIVSASDETNIANIYTATGVAWYYIIDIPNKRFKLPRTKFGFTGLRDTVGNYVAPGLPNLSGSITRVLGDRGGTTFTGVFTDSTNDGGDTNNRSWNDGSIYLERTTVNFDASDSNSIYGNSTTVQPPATQMYLYFYVGNFTQEAIENTAGLNAELFNDKVDLDSSWGFPSSTYDNLTLGATGSSYIAPADGWFCLNKTASGSQFVCMQTQYGLQQSTYGTNGMELQISIPITKGDTVYVYYNAGGTTNQFRFYYAKKTN